MEKRNLKIGIKSSLGKQQLKNKLEVKPEILELFLIDKDFEDLEKFRNSISNLIEENPDMEVFLHCPVILEKEEIVSFDDPDYFFYIKEMNDLCREFENIKGYVMHPENYDLSEKREKVKEILNYLREHLEDVDKYIYLENILGSLTKKKEDFVEFLETNKVKNVCFDFAHFTCNYGEEDFYQMLDYLDKNFNTYWHISDNFFNSGNKLPKNIGEGELDFKKILKFTQKGILETFSSNEDEGIEMKEDYRKLRLIIDEN